MRGAHPAGGARGLVFRHPAASPRGGGRGCGHGAVPRRRARGDPDANLWRGQFHQRFCVAGDSVPDSNAGFHWLARGAGGIQCCAGADGSGARSDSGKSQHSALHPLPSGRGGSTGEWGTQAGVCAGTARGRADLHGAGGLEKPCQPKLRGCPDP